MRRVVEPELLDDLPPADPQAVGSRADLQRLNLLMRHEAILSHALRPHLAKAFSRSRCLRLVEMGAGDGTFLLRLARRLSRLGVTARVTLLDRQDIVSAETRQAFMSYNWSVETVATDVYDWLGQATVSSDLMLSNLFLHHFADDRLSALLRRTAAATQLFIACEPRRSTLALVAARGLGLIGCNRTTRHDAVVSVRAGFVAHELSSLWPDNPTWGFSERPAGWFSHCFVAKQNA